MKRKRIGFREQDELLNKLEFEPLLKQWTHQVRWMYNNSNKCTKVIGEKSVRVMLHKQKERIIELESELKRVQDLAIKNIQLSEYKDDMPKKCIVCGGIIDCFSGSCRCKY